MKLSGLKLMALSNQRSSNFRKKEMYPSCTLKFSGTEIFNLKIQDHTAFDVSSVYWTTTSVRINIHFTFAMSLHLYIQGNLLKNNFRSRLKAESVEAILNMTSRCILFREGTIMHAEVQERFQNKHPLEDRVQSKAFRTFRTFPPNFMSAVTQYILT
jgi:hypothetical protein